MTDNREEFIMKLSELMRNSGIDTGEQMNLLIQSAVQVAVMNNVRKKPFVKAVNSTYIAVSKLL